MSAQNDHPTEDRPAKLTKADLKILRLLEGVGPDDAEEDREVLIPVSEETRAEKVTSAEPPPHSAEDRVVNKILLLRLLNALEVEKPERPETHDDGHGRDGIRKAA